MKILRTKSLVEIIFDDHESKNCFHLDNAKKWVNEVTRQETDLMLLRSEGSVFCSGGNLAEYAAMTTKEEGLLVNREIHQCLTAIASVPCLKIAFVGGDCFGGGVEVLSVCDKIYSLNHVLFGLWQSRMHLSFGWGGFARLSQRMKPADLQIWLSEGRTRSAYWCEKNGLVDEILSQIEMSKRFQYIKDTALGSCAHYFSNGLAENETSFFENLWWSEKHRQILAKFKN
jgi:enoyl-CoA hydratase/carnithine racemase